MKDILDNVLSYRFLKNSDMEFIILVLTFDESSRHYVET